MASQSLQGDEVCISRNILDGGHQSCFLFPNGAIWLSLAFPSSLHSQLPSHTRGQAREREREREGDRRRGESEDIQCYRVSFPTSHAALVALRAELRLLMYTYIPVDDDTLVLSLPI